MSIPNNAIIPFDGAHASIPSGWVRETNLDGKYPKGTANAVNPGVSGGSATHTHTSSSHTHTIVNHSHTFTLSTVGQKYDNTNNTFDAQRLQNSHFHTGTTSATIGGDITGALTYGSVSNDPPYYEVIFIKSSGYNPIPNNGMVLNSATTRTNLSFHTASANKFLKGAATGQNAGGTGGSTTNVHDISHSHSAATHYHTGTSGQPNQKIQRDRNYGDPGQMVGTNHDHEITTSATSITLNNYSGSLTTTETVEPAFRTLNAFKNSSGSALASDVGDIVLWIDTLASIPMNWAVCDGTNGTPDMRNQFLKIPSAASSTTTGGSNTHTHAAQSHTHTVQNPTHNHGHSSVSSHVLGDRRVGNGTAMADPDTQHTIQSVDNGTASYNSASTTADSTDNQPSFVTVAFIQKIRPDAGGSFIFNLL